MFSLEHIHCGLDVPGPVKVVIRFPQKGASLTSVVLVVNDQDNGLDRIHESFGHRKCAIYSHSITPSLNQQNLSVTECFRGRANPPDKARACCEAIQREN